MTLSVIGAGLGRTGTLLLKLDLERLGFGPCYHTRELLKQLDVHVAAWTMLRKEILSIGMLCMTATGRR